MGNNLLSAKATLPVYDRNNLAPRIVHLGFGAFHRAHQGVYADILATEHFSDWGYYEVNLIMAYSVIGLISALKMPEVKDRDLSALEDAAEDQPRVVRAAQPSRSL
ncbi:hypothetical protein [Escherichia coli]|uniref:hypothetical protein n=1 Tax=Escherichia coli TaxID=562 RepID=UPI00385DE95C